MRKRGKKGESSEGVRGRKKKGEREGERTGVVVMNYSQHSKPTIPYL